MSLGSSTKTRLIIKIDHDCSAINLIDIKWFEDEPGLKIHSSSQCQRSESRHNCVKSEISTRVKLLSAQVSFRKESASSLKWMHSWHKLIYVFHSRGNHFSFFSLQVECKMSLKMNILSDSSCATTLMILCWSLLQLSLLRWLLLQVGLMKVFLKNAFSRTRKSWSP